MKFFVAGRSGAIVILDDGTVRVCSSVREQRRLLNREAYPPNKYRSDNVKCLRCKEIWCEIHRHSTNKIECPACGVLLKI